VIDRATLDAARDSLADLAKPNPWSV